ncbi:MAG TPA: hypothetical protein VHR36_08015 [Pyrinomonadaceae bacterium]|nr:hypothetical protein [Pyrinomonadaceae bacterium]
MFAKTNSRRVSTAVLILFISLVAWPSEATAKKKKAMPKGERILWREPENISTRNLLLGPGGEAMKPNLRRVKFIKEETGGFSKKYRIRDASGRVWVAKVGKEAQSETAAVRLLWAAGYVTEINYLVPRLRIPGQGTFENVRLEARPASQKRLEEWKWDDNPFVGSREFAGLKTMMVLFNNWDIKDSNNVIIFARGRRANELRYVISDLGATFGKTGTLPVIWRFTRSRNKPEDYEKAKFIEGVRDNGMVNFRYGGKKREIFDDISVSHAKWLGELLAGLSTDQIKDAFRAANYDPEEIGILTEAVQDRIEQLRSLP